MTNPSNRKGTTGICLQCQKVFSYRSYGIGRAKHFNRNQKFCTKACADAFQTKGWGLDKNGYEVQYRSNGQGRRIFVFRHRQEMETHLGRKLLSHETVHHKDGNRSNNDLSNLELWSSRHGRGQRVEDKVAFCLSFLQDYPELVADLGYKVEKTQTPERATNLPTGMPCINMWMQ